jgi:hypothetical protein
MRLPMIVSVLAAALAFTATTTATAGAATPCKAKQEQAGCVLLNAAYQSGTSRFAVTLGKGEASAAGKVTCHATDGSHSTRNVLYGSYPQLAVKRPKIGKSYTRTLKIVRSPATGQYFDGKVVLTVDVLTAKRARVTYVQDLAGKGPTGAKSTCHGKTAKLLKRVS